MAYTLDIGLALGTSKAGLTDLRAQLVDTGGADVGSAVSTGFTDMGQGNYLWHYTGFPDGHRGGVKFYSAADSGTTLAFAAINPEEAEHTDVKTSTRGTGAALDATGIRAAVGLASANLDTQLSDIPASVWAYGTRTLTSFGSLVADIWTHATRTLTSFGSLAADAAAAVWAAATRTLTSFGFSVSLDMTQSVPTSNTAQTVGDALNAARAQGFGKWVLSGTTLTLYAADGTTVVRTFTLDSATDPTTRV